MDEHADLRRTQELFWELITAPEGVRAAIDDLSRRGVVDGPSLNALFTGDEKLSAVERLDIYANMYFYRLLDCLAEDFPKTLAAAGPAHFHNLVTDYLLRHPSEHPSLRYLGQKLPQFIATHPLRARFPYLVDLARLEWARADLFDAPDAPPLSRDALVRLPQDRAGDARFTLIPAFALLRFDFEVVRFWRRLDESGGGHDEIPGASGAAIHGGGSGNAAREAPAPHASSRGDDPGPSRLPAPARRPTAARVWRKDFIVYHCSLDEEEARCLELAQAGESIGRICQRLAAGRSLAKTTTRAGRMIQSWLEDGILAEVALTGAAR
ncbi:MAG: hypothetical protein AUH92_03320 [Acidobacteria bacterium 13_1_40CM_4_69_4]|nr:MAG: hypothetical protein AUH92_03320 [Acidobacteria bacterium 13_1_40CM_4_69_4]